MLADVLILILGLLLIIKGGDWFVGASVRIAELLRMPRVVIGSIQREIKPPGRQIGL